MLRGYAPVWVAGRPPYPRPVPAAPPPTAHKPARQPSTLLLFGAVPLTLLALVLVAALHEGVGAPLGPAWGRELWELAKSVLYVGGPVYLPLAVYVRQHNARTEAHVVAAAQHHLPPDRDAYRTIQGHGGPRTGPHPALAGTSATSRPRVLEAPGDEDEEP